MISETGLVLPWDREADRGRAEDVGRETLASRRRDPYNKGIMAIIARLAGEGIGPFKSFDFDFSDADGNPHPGPHIFAGINGSGKSTILRTLAWMLEFPSTQDGFQWREWEHLTQGYAVNRAMVVFFLRDVGLFVEAQTLDVEKGWEGRLEEWVRSLLPARSRKSGLDACQSEIWPSPRWESLPELRGRKRRGFLKFGGSQMKVGWVNTMLAAAYGPSRLLKHLDQVNLSAQIKHFRENALSFEATVQNEAIQSWLLNLFSKKAIAKERGENLRKYSMALERFERALTLMCGQEVKLGVDIEPSLQPRLLMYGKRLDFSQLPDGVRSTVGWLADFLMRMDMHGQPPQREPGPVLLLDEVDAHLHPKWQRFILPSIKEALPEVQGFATSHSPFVIASCPGARIHVLELDADGVAHNRPPVDAPIGESILATLHGIFGVNSRFDIETERLLDEWNELHKGQVTGTLSTKQKERMVELTRDLSSRSEELRQIVSPVVSISDSLVSSLRSQAQNGEQEPRRKGKRG